ncbi:MAG: DUF4340 domain-containing protein [Eubacterium sp.]|nr:DUF4340 domain-containing protein [Eubacterium sp.]
MQKRQILQLGLLLALILALAGAVFGIRTYHDRQEEKQAQEAEAATVTLTAFQPESVTAVSYDCSGTQYTFEKEDGEWKSKDLPEMELDQEAFAQFLEQAGAITSDTKVQAQEGESYGFDEPVRTVSITTKNGTSSLIFGMKNEMLNQYYVKTSENSQIYLVEESVYTAFEKTPEEFEQVEEQTVAEDD